MSSLGAQQSEKLPQPVERDVVLQEGQPRDTPSSKRLGTGHFQTIAAESCAVRYSQGALDRASNLLKRLEVLTYHFNRWSKTPMSLAVYLLHRHEWDQLGLQLPYLGLAL